MGSVYSKCERRAYRFLVEVPEGKRPLGGSRHRWSILNWILKKEHQMVWIGFIWPRIGRDK